MLDSAHYREFRNGKRYNTQTKREMSENDSVDENITVNSSENVEGEVSKINTLTQKAVNGHIKGYIAPLTRQLAELTRLLQGMITILHPSHYPGAEFRTTSDTAMHQSDTFSQMSSPS